LDGKKPEAVGQSKVRIYVLTYMGTSRWIWPAGRLTLYSASHTVQPRGSSPKTFDR
jgi:hypothetical protein